MASKKSETSNVTREHSRRSREDAPRPTPKGVPNVSPNRPKDPPTKRVM